LEHDLLIDIGKILPFPLFDVKSSPSRFIHDISMSISGNGLVTRNANPIPFISSNAASTRIDAIVPADRITVGTHQPAHHRFVSELLQLLTNSAFRRGPEPVDGAASRATTTWIWIPCRAYSIARRIRADGGFRSEPRIATIRTRMVFLWVIEM
jgi:hypothetical protein